MSVPSPSPVKTELGQDELRRRTRKLSQRHRTVLLLVDGKRSRDEVVALARQAGVAASFFDELVAMGMVEVAAIEPAPVPPAPAPVVTPISAPVPLADELPEPAAEAVAAASAPPPEEEPAVAVIAALDLPVLLPLARGEPVPESLPTLSVVASPVPAPAPAPAPEAVATPEPGRPVKVKFAPPKYKPKSAVRVSAPAPLLPLPEAPVLTPAKRPARKAAPPVPAKAAPVAADGSEDDLLSEVRSLLIGTLLVDGPVTGSLTALRVGRARTRYELIELVWQIERSLVQARRPREAQGRLIRARELLGLGNTLVDEDTSPGPHSE